MRLLSFLAVAALAGCVLEPEDTPPVQRPDATVVTPRDAGTRVDAGPMACDDFLICPVGLSCSPAGVCVSPGGKCANTSECGGTEICAGGTCRALEGRCTADDGCSGQRCLPSGWCAPAARVIEDELTARCTSRAECGVLGVCRQGSCGACRDDRDCGGAYVCGFDGVCREPFVCTGGTDCAAGNVCTDSACVPSASGCVRDLANDVSGGATPLTSNATTSASICGDDIDWWSVSLRAGEGAQIVARSDVRRNRVHLSVTGDELHRFSQLTLPGFDLVEVDSATVARTLLLRVSRVDVAGPYTLVTRAIRAACAGDELDLYGDSKVEDALLVSAEAHLERHACPGDIDVVSVAATTGDRFTIEPDVGGPGILGVEIRASGGGVLAGRSYTSTGARALTPTPPAADDPWRLVVTAQNVPLSGTPYTVDLSRIRGARVGACANPPALVPGTSTFDLDADLDGPFCDPIAPRAARDRILRFAPAMAGGLLHLTARPTSTTSRALVSVAVIARCEDDLSARACDRALTPRGDASLELVLGVDPLWVVISSTTSGSIDVTATIDEPGNYTCRGGRASPIVASGEIAVDTRAATNTVEAFIPSCGLSAGSGAGPDRFFALSLGADERAVLDLEGPSGGLLWVSTDCLAMDDTCVASGLSEAGAPGRVVLKPARATNYLVAVDGLDSDDAGPYVLHSVIAPGCVADTECMMPERCDDFVCRPAPSSDRCAGDLVPLVNGQAIIQGSTGAAHDDFVSNTCGSTRNGQDVVYAIDVPAGTSELRARITRATWDPILAIRYDLCASATAEQVCNDDSVPGVSLLPDVRIAAPRAGRYYVVVDAYQGAGPFTLQVSTN